MTDLTRHQMVHPGPVHPVRVTWQRTRHREIEAETDDADTLLAAIADVAAAKGVRAATGTFRNAVLATTRYTTGGPARDGKAANYTYIREFGASALPHGTFTFGIDQSGQPFVHCHALIDDGTCLKAGHLFPADCVPDGRFQLSLTALDNIALTQMRDAETLHSVFDVSNGSDQGNALFIRPRPNECVVEAVEAACRAAGFGDAEIRASIGSLNAPVLSVNGETLPMSSVGMEVEMLWGNVKNGQAQLSARLCDEHGDVHEGALKRGLCAICVTAEIVALRR